MPNIGPLELAIVLIIALVIFGPKRLPDLGKALGSGMREFKDSVTGKSDDDEADEKAELEVGTTQPAAVEQPAAAEPVEPVEGKVVAEDRS